LGKAIQLKPEFVHSHYKLGLALDSLGETDKEEIEYRTIRGSTPDSPRRTATWAPYFSRRACLPKRSPKSALETS
jgi:hypothetical protein